MQFDRAAEEDLKEICALLRLVFGKDGPSFRPEVMRWKCFAPHPLFEGGRSFVLRREGRIVAHCCLAPAELESETEVVRACAMTDWVRHPEAPGAGAELYRRIPRLTDVLLGIGGSAAARAVRPRIGFQPAGHYTRFIRIQRPWKRCLRKADWKAWARLGRDLARLARRLPGPPAGWMAVRVRRFDDAVKPVLPQPAVFHGLVCRRTPELLNYYLDCPAAAVEGYVLKQAEETRGYFLLSRKDDECRVAELWVGSNREADWMAGLSVALRHAVEPPTSAVVAAAAPWPWLNGLMQRAGLRELRKVPVSVLDPGDRLAGKPLPVGLLENDAYYL